jgi:hypothetical protein
MSASTGALEVPRGRQSRVWLAVGAIAVATAIGVAALLVSAGSDGSTGTNVGAAQQTAEGSPPTLVERLVNAGLLPRETLEPSKAEPIYSAQDRALMAAIANGLVPEKVLENDHFLIRRLVNQGLIPGETIER